MVILSLELVVLNANDREEDVEDDDSHGDERESHDDTGLEGGHESGSISLAGHDGGTRVGVDGNAHTNETSDNGSGGTDLEGDGSEDTVGPVVNGTDEHKDDDTEHNHEDSHVLVLGPQESVGTGGNSGRDLTDLLENTSGVVVALLSDEKVLGGGDVVLGEQRNLRGVEGIEGSEKKTHGTTSKDDEGGNPVLDKVVVRPVVDVDDGQRRQHDDLFLFLFLV